MARTPTRPTNRRDFKIAVICALTLEAEMVELMLDANWSRNGPCFAKAVGDKNAYTTGAIAGHHVVICHLPGIGANNAAACAASLLISYPGIEVAFVVGICGAVPRPFNMGTDIMLGDCIISTAVTQYDLGRQYPAGFEVKTAVEDSLSRASSETRAIMAKLQTRGNKRRLREQMMIHLQALQSTEEDTIYPGFDKDRLFPAEYNHSHRPVDTNCVQCHGGQRTCTKDCKEIGCEAEYAIPRTSNARRKDHVVKSTKNEPNLFFGRFGSANTVIKSGAFRDKIAKEFELIAFEMEGSGTWETLPTIIIKSASDYADSHKTKAWQTYAAAVAAACLKAVLMDWMHSDATSAREIPSDDLHNTNFDTVPESVVGEHDDTNTVSDTRLQKRDDRRNKLMELLRFGEADYRGNTIREGHLETCGWLVDHELYKAWLDDHKHAIHHGVLWIKGKAGSGKSTLLKFALTQTPTQAQNIRPEHEKTVIISFFFHARGGILENTTLGMYQSLLWQLFQKVPPTQEVLDDESLQIPVKQFGIQTLEDLLCSAVQMIAQHNAKESNVFRVICFVDALDECHEDQIREMLRLFERLDNLSQSTAELVNFRVCFSSRHYPNISFCKGLEIVLEKQKGHLADIKRYIEAELRIGTSQESQLVKTELLEKSGQIFLWVVLVVQLLIKEYDRGRLHALRSKLKDIPQELDELFKNIILRDKDNVEELLLCMQCILYAKRPLSLHEFYFLMMTGVDSTTSNHTNPWDFDQVRSKDMEKFVLSSSKGLAEVTRDVHNRVQFIHESVREFLVKEQARVSIWLSVGSLAPGPSHNRLKSLCQSYFKGVSSRYINIQMFPFLEYALTNVARHAEVAEAHGISQLTFLEEFALSKWLSLESALKRGCHTAEATFLYLLAEYDLPLLIRRELTRFPKNNCPGKETYELPIYVAMAKGNVAAVLELLKPAPDSWINSSNYLQAVLSLCSGMSAQPPLKGQTFLSYLIGCYRPKIPGFLLSSTAWRDSQDTTELLHLAARYCCKKTIRALLHREDLNIDARDSANRTALYIAARNGYSEIVQILLENHAAIEKGRLFRDWEETALLVTARYDHQSTLSTLCDSKANLGATYRYGATASHVAAFQGNSSAISILVRYGSRLDIYNQNGWLPLHVAAYHGQFDTVEYLLSRCLDPDVKTKDGFTSLWLAAQNGHSDVVDLLLRQRASVLHKAAAGWTVLHAATMSGSLASVQSIVQAGISLNATTSDVLMNWPSSGFSEVVIKPDDRTQHRIAYVRCFRPLHLAMLKYDLSMITLLINLGATLDKADLDNSMYKDLVPHDLSLVESKPLRKLGRQARWTMKRGWAVLQSWILEVDAQHIDIVESNLYSEQQRRDKDLLIGTGLYGSGWPGDKAPIYNLRG